MHMRVRTSARVCAGVSMPVRVRACVRVACVRACAEACAYAGARGSEPLALTAELPSFLLGVRRWAQELKAEDVGVRIAHEVAPVIVAPGVRHHSLVRTIDGGLGFPDVESQLGLSAEIDQIPLVIRRSGDGNCTTQVGLHCYAGPATTRAFGKAGTLDTIGFLYDKQMFKKMLYPTRSEGSMECAAFKYRGAAYAVFTNLIEDGRLHPTLQDPVVFAEFVVVFPELKKLVVDGNPQVAAYTIKHVTSVEETNAAAHQALHTDSPSSCSRTVVAGSAVMSDAEEAAFCATHAEGIIASFQRVENHAISTPAGNVQTRAWNQSIGAEACRRVDVAGFVSPSSRFEAGGIIAPGSLVPKPNAPAAATDKCPICTAVAACASGVLRARRIVTRDPRPSPPPPPPPSLSLRPISLSPLSM